MPRRVIKSEDTPRTRWEPIVEELAAELKSDRETGGQPLIEEEHFKTGAVRVLVIWDRWEHVLQEDRAEIISKGYELAFGNEIRDKIGLAIGLTVPEAQASGLLPFEVIPALRRSDPVSELDCFEALKAEGASNLFDDHKPHLFARTEADAESYRKRLIKRLPESEPIWLVRMDVGTAQTRLPAEAL